MAMALTFRAAVAPALPAAKLRRQASAKPSATTAFFGKREPAPTKPAPKAKANVKSLYGPTGRNPAKPVPKPLFSFGAKPASDKKQTPAAKKAVPKSAAKKAVPKSTRPGSGYSFAAGSPAAAAALKGKAKVVVMKKQVVKKKQVPASAYVIKTAAVRTTIKKKPAFKPAPAPTPKPAAAKEPREAATYDKDQVGTFGVAAIFAGGFLLTLAVLPAAVETALETVGIGYSAFFAYSYFTDATSRDDFGKKLDEIEDSTGLNLKQAAVFTGELAGETSRQLAEAAEAAGEKRAATAAAAKTAAAAAAETERSMDSSFAAAVASAEVNKVAEEAMEEK
uniref:Cyanobacterial aminoacyl-tRNA synthetase CAAD domain-containing protein n=1 Tax=Mantoniella antarctica TaxID=81844 RepID=A0A7S0SD70_9CHLO